MHQHGLYSGGISLFFHVRADHAPAPGSTPNRLSDPLVEYRDAIPGGRWAATHSDDGAGGGAAGTELVFKSFYLGVSWEETGCLLVCYYLFLVASVGQMEMRRTTFSVLIPTYLSRNAFFLRRSKKVPRTPANCVASTDNISGGLSSTPLG